MLNHTDYSSKGRQCHMTKEEKQNHVENIIKAADIFDDAPALPFETLHFRPDPDRWTIYEHVIHCLDVDIANFTRYRVGIVAPGTEIIGMDGQWTAKLKYETIDLEEAIDTIKLIRKMTYSHFLTLIDDDWTQYSFLYKKYGNLNFETFAPVFFRHPMAHREMIDKLLEEVK